MNDFTKDMLLDLRKCVRIAAMEYGDCERLDFLERKLQSMIDNYCEHGDVEYPEEFATIPYCRKCRESIT